LPHEGRAHAEALAAEPRFAQAVDPGRVDVDGGQDGAAIVEVVRVLVERRAKDARQPVVTLAAPAVMLDEAAVADEEEERRGVGVWWQMEARRVRGGGEHRRGEVDAPQKGGATLPAVRARHSLRL